MSTQTLRPLSPEEWKSIWATTDARTVGKTMNLSAFAELCSREHRRRYETYGPFRWDNARYVVHLEDCLSRGLDVPPDYIATVTDDDLRYDGYCFPLLNAARMELRKLPEENP